MAVGRKKLKEAKVKIGFSVNKECVELIDLLAEKSGKNKSRIVEDAIKELSKIKGNENG